MRLSLVGRFFFFGPSRSFPRRITKPEDIALLGFITILPLPLGPNALAAAALRSALDGLASLMYALRLAASDATPSPRRGCSRICPS